MNVRVKRWVSLVGLAALASVLLFGLSVDSAWAQGPLPQTPWRGSGPGMMGGQGSGWGMMGRGMMGGQGSGWGMTDGGMMGSGMMGVWGPGTGRCPSMGGWGYPSTGTPITLDQATQAAEDYIAAYGNPDLELAEVMEFADNFYAQAQERNTGRYAFEILIDRFTGAVYPEPGPNMMWNTRYGHMGGMMGGQWNDTPSAEMTIAPEQARTLAQQHLDTYLDGAEVDDEVDAFYGYYTIHILQDGQIAGMLSVNGYTGQVWYHSWHGAFLGMGEHD